MALVDGVSQQEGTELTGGSGLRFARSCAEEAWPSPRRRRSSRRVAVLGRSSDESRPKRFARSS
eukprot:6475504-Pyramimonas_sp.AAC.1